jgi:Tol biopolymer transport system component/DNA-binding winged helix-turn-helix (wHTH) protein
MNMQLTRIYEFGGFRLDPRNHRLTREGGEVIALTPKEFEVLLVLVDHAGDVVSKETLLDAVWKDAFVAEETMMRNISWLRKKLEAGSAEKIIETIPKFGYRLAVEVRSINLDQLIVEETTVQRLVVEETVTVPDASEPGSAERPALPPAPARHRNTRLLALVVSLLLLAVAAAAVALIYFRRPARNPILVAKVSPFSGLTGREDMPAFSPDGRQLAFSWNGGEGNNLDIYVKGIGPGDPLQLTKTAESEYYPAFAPDGSQLAFVRAFANYDEVVMIPVLGGAERKLATVSSSRSSISFSPDGKFLAVVDFDPALKHGTIFLLNVQTGERRALDPSADCTGDNTPRFSPDGSKVAFLRSFGDFVQEVVVAAIAGGAPRQLTTDKTRIYSLGWGAHGREIYFVSPRQNDQRNLWRIAAAGGDPELIATGGKNITNLAVSSDGNLIAFTEAWDDNNIWRLAPGKPPQKLIISTRADNSPDISPDGGRIAFVSDRTGDSQIWVAGADGKNPRQVTDAKFPAGSPRFSPDGRSIAYDIQADGSSDICTVPVEGGESHRLTNDIARDALPSWSADGKWIFFVSNRAGALDLWKMPAGGGPAVQITKQRGFESFAAPDGKTLYYSKGRQVAGLWSVPIDGGDEQPVPELADAGYWRFWTGTEKGIYYVGYVNGAPYPIKFFDFASRKTTVLTDTDMAPLGVFSGLAASNDGQLILYAHSDQIGSNIMLVQLTK